MCTNQREIKNKYTGKMLYVKCGHCPACQVEKAMHRVQRIRNTMSDQYDTIMVTLTYARGCAPYVLRDAAYKFAHGKLRVLKVFRDCSFRYKRYSSSYDTRLVRCDDMEYLGEVPYKHDVNFSGNKDLAHEPDHIGVCWYPDLQLFYKRLRKTLDYYGYDYKFKAYSCDEYGTSSNRPHFHLLLFIPKGTEKVFQAAVNKSWQFSNLSKFPRSFEKAFRASSYVASYVNKPNGFPDFLKTYFQTKCSYSKGFGLAHSEFSFYKILEKFQRGSISYHRQVFKQGISRLVTLPIPSYVIGRYFPKFKGSSRYTLPSFLSIAERICRLDYDKTESEYLKYDLSSVAADGSIIYYNEDDIHKISVRLTNAWSRINDLYPDCYISSLHDYLTLYYNVWSCYSATVLRLHLENPDVPMNEKYDNLEDVKCKLENGISSLPIGFKSDDLKETDPNKYLTTILRTSILTSAFNDSLYKKKVTDKIYHVTDVNCEL